MRCSRIILCCRFVGRLHRVLLLFAVQRRDHIPPLCLALLVRHLRKCLLTLAQAAFLLRLLALLKLLHQINRINIRLILCIRHRPKWCHILDRRDKECVGAEILQSRCKRTNQAIAHIDRTSAHPLEHTADMLDKFTARPCHNHTLRAFSALHHAEDLNGERTDLTGRIKHRICRSLHARRHLTV